MAASSTRKWIELNWLRKGWKEIPLPELVFTNTLEYSGEYLRPERDEYLVEERYYALDRGLIIVNIHDNEEFLYKRDTVEIMKTIIHEWRHHWQYFTGKFYNPIGSAFNEEGDYEENIVDFYRENVNEMDAFLFSMRKGGLCDALFYQYKLLVKAGLLYAK